MTRIVLDLDQLDRLRRDKRLRLLATLEKVRPYDSAELDGDPDLLVRELIRLARLGQAVELEGDHGRLHR